MFHDAENLLDEVECQVVSRQVAKMHAKIGRNVRRFFSRSNPLVFRISVGHKIKDIGVRLDEIAANKAKFHLAEKPERNDHVMMHGRRLQMTHSFVRASEIVVREHDKEKLVHLLMEPDEKSDLSVIPVHELGGMGKTTLVKLVYNDSRVSTHFDLKI